MRKKMLVAMLIAVTLFWAVPDLKEYYEYHKTASSIVMLTNAQHTSGGTGFEVRYGNKDFTVSNAHVCEMGYKDGYLRASGVGFKDLKIKILKQSPDTDLCLLEPIKLLPKLQLRKNEFKKGDQISIWGHPRLRPLEISKGKVTIESHVISVSAGIIFNKEEEDRCRFPKNHIVSGWFGMFKICIETVRAQLTSARIEPGNSGSPVLDQDMQVGGVAFAGLARTDGKAEAEIIPWASLYLFLARYTNVYIGLE